MADRPIPVEPIGRERCVTLHPPYESWSPTYPESSAGREFQRRRVRARLLLGDVARRLGWSVAEVSGLEHGRYTVPDFEALWREVSGG